ncbi:Glycoside hydrolase family 18, catalytic domain [Sesbania bispinosa]|nr:Glycoside hydrolase family 18, catalytic domain [Sesbania bispinosa]
MSNSTSFWLSLLTTTHLLLPPTENSTSSGTVKNLSPEAVYSIKSQHPNVRVAVSLGGNSVRGGPVYFNPSSIDSWVSNAVSSLTKIIKMYHLDGIDIYYEHFKADSDTFAECIGRLIQTPQKQWGHIFCFHCSIC